MLLVFPTNFPILSFTVSVRLTTFFIIKLEEINEAVLFGMLVIMNVYLSKKEQKNINM